MKHYNRCSILVAALAWCLPGFQSFGQEPQSFPSSLTLSKAVELSLQYHPSLRLAEANVSSSSASVTLARSNYFPMLNATGSAVRTDGAFVFNPTIPPRIQSYNTYTAALSLQQTIYDFGKTGGRVSGTEDLLQASSVDLQGTRVSVMSNVEIAYYGVLQAQGVVQVDVESLTQAEAHLLEARAGFSIGTRPQFDVIKSQVHVANANVNLITARNQLRLARLQLENAIGLHAPNPYRAH